MLDKNELLFDEIYERTKDFGRIQFIKEIMRLQRENQQLKDKIKTYEDPEDMTLMFMWCEDKAKDKIKELEHNWNELKKYIEDVIIECKTVINTILPEFEKITSRNSGKTLLTNEYNNQQMIIKSFKVMLSKMEELEKIRGDKDE